MSTGPRRQSEWRWPVRIAVAGAASVLVMVAYLADLGATNPQPVGVRRVAAPTQPTLPSPDGPTSTTAAVASPSTAVPRSGTAQSRTTTPKSDVQTRATAERAALDWVDALGRGDVKTAAALVDPKSRRYIESLGGNVEGFMRESEEGYGGWGASPDRSTTEIDLGTVHGARKTIVVVTGTWRGEGEDGFRSDVIPAVLIGNEWKVEPVAFDPETGGRLEVIAPTRSDEGAEFSPLSPDA